MKCSSNWQIQLYTFSYLSYLLNVWRRRNYCWGMGSITAPIRPRSHRIHYLLSRQPLKIGNKASHPHCLMFQSLGEWHTAGMKYPWLWLMLPIFSISTSKLIKRGWRIYSLSCKFDCYQQKEKEKERRKDKLTFQNHNITCLSIYPFQVS